MRFAFAIVALSLAGCRGARLVETEWAASDGLSDFAYASVGVGDRETDVRATIGDPIRVEGRTLVYAIRGGHTARFLIDAEGRVESKSRR